MFSFGWWLISKFHKNNLYTSAKDFDNLPIWKSVKSTIPLCTQLNLFWITSWIKDCSAQDIFTEFRRMENKWKMKRRKENYVLQLKLTWSILYYNIFYTLICVVWFVFNLIWFCFVVINLWFIVFFCVWFLFFFLNSKKRWNDEVQQNEKRKTIHQRKPKKE